MKHGNKKGKAKAPSGKKSKPATKTQASQGGNSIKKTAASPKAAAPARTSGKSDSGKGGRNEPGSFSNPVVANAFKRAVKKYPSAFKRLTD